MPIVFINSLPPSDSSVIGRMSAEVRDLGAGALNTSRGNIWVIFQPIQPGNYLHGENLGSSPQQNLYPVVVIIKAQAGRSSADRGNFVKAVTNSIGRNLSIPANNVWVHYQEMNPKDVWFEGSWAG